MTGIPFALNWLDAFHGLRPGTGQLAFEALMADLTEGKHYELNEEGDALITAATHLCLVAHAGWTDPASRVLRAAMAQWGWSDVFPSTRAFCDAALDTPGPRLTEDEQAEVDADVDERMERFWRHLDELRRGERSWGGEEELPP
jgi:hypothetical protein